MYPSAWPSSFGASMFSEAVAIIHAESLMEVRHAGASRGPVVPNPAVTHRTQ